MLDLTGEAELPPSILDPLTRLKVDLWHSAQLATVDRLCAAGAGVSRPIRVIFLVPDTSLWDVFGSVYADMIAHPMFEPSVLAFRRMAVGGALSKEETRQFFAERQIEATFWGFDDDECPPIRPKDADILFYTLGSVAYPPTLQIEFTSLSFLTCYLPYGFLLAREYDYQFNQDFHHSAWRVFAATAREEALYRHYSHRRTPNVALTGYPKFDALSRAEKRPAARPTVIWAPHWSIGEIYPRLNMGTFHTLCMKMLEVFDAFPGMDFLYKPHPTLAHALEQTSFMSGASYATYLEMLRSRPNVRLWLHGDYAALFANSSAMITDSVSFLAEYLLADRPLLFLDRPDRRPLSPVGEEVINLHHKGRTFEDIKAFIDRCVVRADDPKAQGRLEKAKQILGVSGQSASGKIIGTILEDVTGGPRHSTSPSQTRVHNEFRSIDRTATKTFFEERAARFDATKPYTSILYQDAKPNIALERDAAEKALILPRLLLSAEHRVLDIGCGVGRWADAVLGRVGRYVGTDISPGLIARARERLGQTQAEFVVSDALNLESGLGAHAAAGFDRFLISGLLLYLNDHEVKAVAQAVARLARPQALLYLREPLALSHRLTLDRHWSDELQCHYSAIYRTAREICALLDPPLCDAGFEPIEFQPLYADPALQNRAETRQFFALSKQRV